MDFSDLPFDVINGCISKNLLEDNKKQLVKYLMNMKIYIYKCFYSVKLKSSLMLLDMKQIHINTK